MKQLCLCLLLWCACLQSAHAELNVVVSIKPLALISKSILGERGQVIALVDAQQSPHDYAMKPSDRIAIQRANMLVWVAPDFEFYLSDIFVEQSKEKALITFSQLPGVSLLHETSGELDPHMWLDSRNAMVLATAIAETASVLDVENAAYFQSNLEQLLLQISTSDEQVAAIFSDKSRKTYAVYHNAYRYFEERFGLHHGVVLLRSSALQPNVQEIMRARNSIQESRPGCLMIEFDSNRAIIDTMLGGYQVAKPTIDILGMNVEFSATGYVTLLRNLAEQFRDCIYQ